MTYSAWLRYPSLMEEIRRYRSRRPATNMVRAWGGPSAGYGVEPIKVRGLTWYRVVEYTDPSEGEES